MSNESKKEYIAFLRLRYLKVRRKERSVILDEIERNFAIHRKSAVRLMLPKRVTKVTRGRKRTYDLEATRALRVLWQKMDYMCSKKIVAALPRWLPFFEASGAIKNQLLKMSASTVDRILKPFRASLRRKQNTGTKPGRLLKNIIPIKPLDFNITKPGAIEADSVAHCGDSLSGEFAWSLTFTDILLGWTLNRAVWHKEVKGVVDATEHVEKRLPFIIKSFSSDNGNEFLKIVKYVDPKKPMKKLDPKNLTLPEKWLLEELASKTEQINRCLEQYRVNEAVELMYHLIWGSFCDWGLEVAKETLNGNDEAARDQTTSVLVYVLEGIMRLASPVMPFVTEEVWDHLPVHPQWARGPSLVVTKYPDAAQLMRFPEAASDWASFQDLVTGIRSIRSQAGIPPKDALDAFVYVSTPSLKNLFETEAGLVRRLAGLKALVVKVVAPGGGSSKGPALVYVGKGFEAYVPAEGIMDVAKEVKRLSSDVGRVEKIVVGLQAKLGNESFVARAPDDVIVTTRAQLENMTAQLFSLKKNLASLQG